MHCLNRLCFGGRGRLMAPIRITVVGNAVFAATGIIPAIQRNGFVE